jgi:outer membrane lipoprotein SlyB
MEVKAHSNRIHPLVAAASVSVILVSLVGIGAMTGLFPNSHSSGSSATASTTPAPIVAQAPALEQAHANALAPSTAESKPTAASGDADTVKRSASSGSAQKSYAPRPVKTAQAPSNTSDYREPARAQAPAICYDCGRVEAVNAVQTQAAPSGVGMIAGGVVGGLLGNQVGGGNGKKIATVAGAVGGGYAGHEIEKRTRSTTTYEVRVRMEDGRTRTFPYNSQPQWSSGDRVRVVDGYLKARG